MEMCFLGQKQERKDCLPPPLNQRVCFTVVWTLNRWEGTFSSCAQTKIQNSLPWGGGITTIRNSQREYLQNELPVYTAHVFLYGVSP